MATTFKAKINYCFIPRQLIRYPREKNKVTRGHYTLNRTIRHDDG